MARSIGPASSARAVADVAIGPLLSILGHAVPTLVPCPFGLAGAAWSGGAPVIVVVLPWTTSLNEGWRDSIRGALAVDAAWALVAQSWAVFN